MKINIALRFKSFFLKYNLFLLTFSKENSILNLELQKNKEKS